MRQFLLHSNFRNLICGVAILCSVSCPTVGARAAITDVSTDSSSMPLDWDEEMTALSLLVVSYPEICCLPSEQQAAKESETVDKTLAGLLIWPKIKLVCPVPRTAYC